MPAPVLSTPATPKRMSVFSASYGPATAPAPAPFSNTASNRFLSPSKKRQLIYGTPPLSRTPSRVPLPMVHGTPRADLAKQLPEPPQLPEGRVGYDPELRSMLANHVESLDKLIDRYSRLKSGLAQSLNVKLTEVERERTNAKYELGVVQKQLSETVEATERLKQELAAARARLRQLTDDRCGMELKLSELKGVMAETEARVKILNKKKTGEKEELIERSKEAKQEVKFLEEITGMSIVITGVDRLRFNFKLIDMNRYDRVFHVELDLAEFEYRIISIDPPLAEESALLRRLNQTRDFYRFLCGIKQAFTRSAQTQ